MLKAVGLECAKPVSDMGRCSPQRPARAYSGITLRAAGDYAATLLPWGIIWASRMLLQEFVNFVGSPFIVQFDSPVSRLHKHLQLLGVTPYVVDIGSAHNELDLFESFRAAMQMPYRELTNWDALDEALADLSWLKPNSINLILEGVGIFSRRDQQSFHALTSLLNAVGEEWAKPVTDGEWWDRPSVPFNVYVRRDVNQRFQFNFPKLPD